MTSKAEIDRAGRRLARGAWTVDDERVVVGFLSWSVVVMDDLYRICSEHLGTHDTLAVRGKQLHSVLEKLRRGDVSRLTGMGDVVGARVVVPTLRRQRSIARRIQKALDGTIVDYVSRPTPAGYRALHVRARLRGRPVEVQVRTRRQHEWAVSVEQYDLVNGTDVKHGRGPERVVATFVAVSEAIARTEV